MAEYTPESNIVRSNYAFGVGERNGIDLDRAYGEFDRWLAKVIAEAEMKGWREGYEEGRTDGSDHG